MLLVAEVTNGQEAIELFRTDRSDVTLIDLQMPIMNGIDAIIAIRSEHPNARFVVLPTRRCAGTPCIKSGSYWLSSEEHGSQTISGSDQSCTRRTAAHSA
jgi:response regulator RpfG family c-di-GMP phosphodiesterase